MGVVNLVPPYTVTAREGAVAVQLHFSNLDDARQAGVDALKDDDWGKDLVVTITAREWLKPLHEDGSVRDVAPVAIYRR